MWRPGSAARPPSPRRVGVALRPLPARCCVTSALACGSRRGDLSLEPSGAVLLAGSFSLGGNPSVPSSVAFRLRGSKINPITRPVESHSATSEALAGPRSSSVEASGGRRAAATWPPGHLPVSQTFTPGLPACPGTQAGSALPSESPLPAEGEEWPGSASGLLSSSSPRASERKQRRDIGNGERAPCRLQERSKD